MSRKFEIFAEILEVLRVKEKEMLEATEKWSCQRLTEDVFYEIKEKLFDLHQQIEPEFFEEYMPETVDDYEEEMKPKIFS